MSSPLTSTENNFMKAFDAVLQTVQKGQNTLSENDSRIQDLINNTQALIQSKERRNLKTLTETTLKAFDEDRTEASRAGVRLYAVSLLHHVLDEKSHIESIPTKRNLFSLNLDVINHLRAIHDLAREAKVAPKVKAAPFIPTTSEATEAVEEKTKTTPPTQTIIERAKALQRDITFADLKQKLLDDVITSIRNDLTQHIASANTALQESIRSTHNRLMKKANTAFVDFSNGIYMMPEDMTAPQFFALDYLAVTQQWVFNSNEAKWNALVKALEEVPPEETPEKITEKIKAGVLSLIRPPTASEGTKQAFKKWQENEEWRKVTETIGYFNLKDWIEGMPKIMQNTPHYREMKAEEKTANEAFSDAMKLLKRKGLGDKIAILEEEYKSSYREERPPWLKFLKSA